MTRYTLLSFLLLTFVFICTTTAQQAVQSPQQVQPAGRIVDVAAQQAAAAAAAVQAQPQATVLTPTPSAVVDVKRSLDLPVKPIVPILELPENRQFRFVSAFVASISMILVSEFGDKTFFIAAIMAMRQNRWEVFMSAMAALALMTVLSAAMGFTLPNILPPSLTHAMATLLFFFFGIRLLYDAYHMESGNGPNEELEEVEEELEKVHLDNKAGSLEEALDTSAKAQSRRVTRFWRRFFSPVFIQCFTMTFLAEWGDRSQIATIALAAAKDPVGVTLGGIIGHSCCTGVAVLGGKLLATRISERGITLVGGVLFLVFAIHSCLAQE